MQDIEYIDFPKKEYDNYIKRLEANQIIYTTRVSDEVGKKCGKLSKNLAKRCRRVFLLLKKFKGTGKREKEIDSCRW